MKSWILIIIVAAIMVFSSGCVAPPKDTKPSTVVNYNPVQQTAIETTIPTPTSFIDAYPDALPINSAYHIIDSLNDLRYPPSGYPYPSPTKNDVSVQVIRAFLWDSYTIQKPTKYQTVSVNGKKFVVVVVEVLNYSGNQKIISPNPSNFELIYNGQRYSRESTEYPIQAAGNNYKSESIARLEKTGGVLIYEVPSSATLDQSYVQLIYKDENPDDTEQNPIWHLK
jgi:hypothetical protein